MSRFNPLCLPRSACIFPASLLFSLALLCGAPRAPLRPSFPGATLRVKVMSYNVLQFPPNLGDNDEAERLQRIVNVPSLLRPLPDIFAVQELMNQESWEFFQRNIKPLFPYHTKCLASECPPTGWDSHTGPCNQGLLTANGGISIASRHPIAEAHSLVFSTFAGLDALGNKGAVLARIMFPDDRLPAGAVKGYEEKRRPVWVVSLHLQSDQGPISCKAAREAEMTEIKEWINAGIASGKFKINAEDPVIFAGDFNIEYREKIEDFKSLLKVGKLKVDFSLADFAMGSYSTTTNLLAKLGTVDSNMPFDMTKMTGLLMRKGFGRLLIGCQDPRAHPLYSLAAFLQVLKTFDWEGTTDMSKLGCYSNAMKALQHGPVDAGALAKRQMQNDLIDYIGWREDFLQPVATLPVTVLDVKSQEDMHWDKMAKYFPETKGKYRDISDHYPVYAEFYFE